mmetsp:Transcript_23681/g.71021  ORF Transcript_23681/g.71021 Transcript_23681/m.71021 type:complete len:217 (-) Transcript_23681:24-674(-)
MRKKSDFLGAMAPRLLNTGLVLACLAGRCVPAAARKTMIDVTTRNFDEETRAHDNMLLVFYAPWCGHCKRLEPTLAQLANGVAPDASGKLPYQIARCDGTEHRVLAQRFGVRGFPSLYYIRGRSEVIVYEGGRGAAEIDAFLRNGHADYKPLSLVKSPFGPIGRAKGWCAAAGLAALDAHESLSESIGVYPAYFAVAVLGMALVVALLVVPLLILA